MASTYINLPTSDSTTSGGATEATLLNVLAAVNNTNSELMIIDGHLVPVTLAAGLPNNPAPTNALQIGGIDGAGNLRTLSVDTYGVLDVNIVNTENFVVFYNEITNTAINIESTILSYTVSGSKSVLKGLTASGQNIGEIMVYLNGSVIDKQYLYYTSFNLNFDFKSLEMAMGDLLEITGINRGEDLCNFNAKIEVLEFV